MEIHFAISVFSVTCMKRLKLELKAKCCNFIKFAGGANSVMSFLTRAVAWVDLIFLAHV